MNQVWLIFAFLHILMDIACLTIHMCGGQYKAESQPHNVIFCGTFSGYMIFAIVRAARLIIGQRTVLIVELLVETTRMTLHFLCAILAMHYAEEDIHLVYMGPQQELDHVYFGYCKMQGVACIAAGSVSLLQCVLLLDLQLKSLPNEDQQPLVVNIPPPVWDAPYDDMTIDQRDHFSRTNANIYFLGRNVDHWLCLKFKWFRELALRQPLRFKMAEYTSTEGSAKARSLVIEQTPVEPDHIPISQTTTSNTSESASVDEWDLKWEHVRR